MADFYHETERLILRDWREEDWEPFWDGTNTPAVMKWLGGLADEAGRADARERLEGYRRDHGHTFWVVESKEDGAILGFCGLKRCNEPKGPIGDMEAGWRLREDAWGKGYAKEAAIATLQLGFERFAAPHVIALTVDGNEPSWRLMKRLGMQRREDMDFPDTVSWAAGENIIVYRIEREEWEAQRG
ncbi:MAG: GNAT family N-acetyltransferase [Pseudomonadota bacterium]